MIWLQENAAQPTTVGALLAQQLQGWLAGVGNAHEALACTGEGLSQLSH